MSVAQFADAVHARAVAMAPPSIPVPRLDPSDPELAALVGSLATPADAEREGGARAPAAAQRAPRPPPQLDGADRATRGAGGDPELSVREDEPPELPHRAPVLAPHQGRAAHDARAQRERARVRAFSAS